MYMRNQSSYGKRRVNVVAKIYIESNLVQVEEMTWYWGIPFVERFNQSWKGSLIFEMLLQVRKIKVHFFINIVI